ncbi:TonB-dependent receptor family protein [Ideonella sp.]|jgi:iron complex outermembrane receptor protein|uniref:TonB-dependent receptor family protein n=1 Tax=Ideonella sp. TaxID=1929293 RepID=UPI0037C0DA9C
MTRLNDPRRWLRLHTLAAASAVACAAGTQAQSVVTPTEEVVVTGSLTPQRVQDAPFAITVVDREALRRSGPLINLSEAMSQVPGVVVNNRGNYAQDLQISSRGFGARAAFGVRGLRLVADGIPASGPDGQGQVAHFDLAGAQRIEVLRGPFSVLYGNSSGGVIALVGAPVKTSELEVGVDAGSFGLRQVRGSVGLALGQGFDARLSAAHMEVEGFRPHSAAQRDLGQARLGWQNETDRVVLQLGSYDQPADDPLGLTRADFNANPYQTASQATQFNTRKTARQTQAGVSWRHLFSADTLGGVLREGQVAVYSGDRSVTQWQAIPAATQANPRHGGGVVDFDRAYSGVDARLRWGLGPVELVTGVAQERQRDDRRGYENFTGTGASQVLGVTGKLRRDEQNTATSRDVYTQAEWAFSPDWVASAGVRSGKVRMSARDAYLSNGDDSGDLSFSYTNPVAGVRWQALKDGSRSLQVHASAARGFEAPTLGELAYKPDGSAGFNTALKPQTSRQLELGLKYREPALAVDAVVFDTRVSDELATLSNSGGRSTFQNVGATQRRGLELSGRWEPTRGWRTQAALTWLDATYSDAFKACAGTPCTTPTVDVPAGNRIAGTQGRSAWAELAWRDSAWGEFALEARGVGRVAVNDSNSDFAPGYGLAALRWSQQWKLGQAQRLELTARIDNLADRVYAGSVIVGDGNGRFFEAGAPRSVWVGVRWVNGL